MSASNSQEIDLSVKQEKAAFRHVRRLRRFYAHLLQLVPVALLLAALNFWVCTHRLWAPWVILFMGPGVLIHGLWLFGSSVLLGPPWELKTRNTLGGLYRR